tara:strand:+ start:734 stop:925 length:192 start_codon:yes stop_codon:yes gene_type:complete
MQLAKRGGRMHPAVPTEPIQSLAEKVEEKKENDATEVQQYIQEQKEEDKQEMAKLTKQEQEKK